MDSAGICEFTGTKNAEKEAVNQKVTDYFNETIEHREDGYYVRLLYKDNHPPLPDNRNIAVKRLHSVINMLRNNADLLRNYDNTLRDQQKLGIIEEIPNEQNSVQIKKGKILHYISHQPVLTPHKETTKLRIVFNASSHYRECPSLNDILHQGPFILPELYGLLIRFRIPTYVTVSDVEKAFLQVRLHEQDRDAARFLWLRNLESPVTENNMITFHFTRVTFGLNVSPFLLAGTVQYHLQNAVEGKKLAQEIRDNLYVDNLILGAHDIEELRQKAIVARQIFKDMNMNLREFLANTNSLQELLPQQAIAKSTTLKVLGIAWDAPTDCLKMRTLFPCNEDVTKRLIARQIASIYDPLGWLVPLPTPAKHFQQQLWKQKFAWDTQLPEPVSKQWKSLASNVDNFEVIFPRRFSIDIKQIKLAIFADASDIAMATCAYFFDNTNSSLVMARCKLPSIRTLPTIPKLEINALTMAARLAWAVYQALESSSKTPNQILLFSDTHRLPLVG
ncbi:hypothetical protein RB195_005764 [Necator americanus]|uniref:Reverse transcriptase domain-containing protein n=1 Tax=Necator americanus TaxID=51031 RepID=A0ABR1BTB6_NECAM